MAGWGGGVSSLGGGGLSVVEVASAAVGIVVRHADRGAVQVEVAAARAAGEAADGTTAPGRDQRGAGEVSWVQFSSVAFLYCS